VDWKLAPHHKTQTQTNFLDEGIKPTKYQGYHAVYRYPALLFTARGATQSAVMRQ